jgi:hypothetical protein
VTPVRVQCCRSSGPQNLLRGDHDYFCFGSLRCLQAAAPLLVEQADGGVGDRVPGSAGEREPPRLTPDLIGFLFVRGSRSDAIGGLNT